MKDREFLCWLHERLERVHGESKLVDYMHKLRAIIGATPPEQETPNIARYNSLEELLAESAPEGKREERKGCITCVNRKLGLTEGPCKKCDMALGWPNWKSNNERSTTP